MIQCEVSIEKTDNGWVLCGTPANGWATIEVNRTCYSLPRCAEHIENARNRGRLRSVLALPAKRDQSALGFREFPR